MLTNYLALGDGQPSSACATINFCCVFYKYLCGLRPGNYCFWIVTNGTYGRAALREGTRDRYRGVINNYLRPTFGNPCPKDVGATISTATATTSATMSKRNRLCLRWYLKKGCWRQTAITPTTRSLV